MNAGSGYLDWPVSVRLSDSKVNESGHRQTHIQPVTEAEVVDELKHILHTQEDQTHDALQTPTNPCLSMPFIYLADFTHKEGSQS